MYFQKNGFLFFIRFYTKFSKVEFCFIETFTSDVINIFQNNFSKFTIVFVHEWILIVSNFGRDQFDLLFLSFCFIDFN